MSYTRLHWVESETPLSAENMNNIEDGIEELKSQKVDKVSGKALSDNNYTTEEKQKLAGIAAGAEVNRTYTEVTGEPAANASVAFGGTVTVSQVAQSSIGQVSVTSRTVTFPNSDATTSAHGLMTAADKTKLNGIQAGAQVNPGNATTSAAGLMSAADKTKLNGVATGAEVNQNAFSNVKVGSSTVAADAKTDTLELAAGTNISLTADTTNDKVTITNSTPNVTTTTAGLMSASDKIKLNSIAAGAQVNPGNATTSAAGLMSAADKAKLNGIQSGARPYTAGAGISISDGVISVSYSNAANTSF